MSEQVEREESDRRIQVSLIEDIQESTEQLGNAVSDLTVKQNRQIQRLHGWARITTVGLMLDLILTLLGMFLLNKSYDNAHKIDANQSALKERQGKTKPALCSVYDLLLDSYNPNSLSAKLDPAKYEGAFAQLEDGALVFGCTHHVKGRD